jgi:membrane fusion protein (multidrug efflux system)
MKIKAPFEGEIGLFSISEGAQINPGQEITRLVRSDPMNVEFQVPESEVKDIHVDDEVQVLVEHADVLPVNGVIKAIEPYADPATHSTRVIANLDNSEGKFRDGSFASVTLFLSRDDEAIVVPKESIVHDGDQDFVYIVVNGRARQRPVIISFQDKGKVKIEGVNEGDVVVTDPVELLVDGIPVQPEAAP